MSIYISGMKLPPKECRVIIAVDGDGAVYRMRILGDYVFEQSDKRQAIEVPPHGRLVDEEQILRLIDEQRQDEYNRTHSPKMMWSNVVNAFEWLLQWADTIIPADPEGGADG